MTPAAGFSTTVLGDAEIKDKGSAIPSGLVKTDSIPLCIKQNMGILRHVFLP